MGLSRDWAAIQDRLEKMRNDLNEEIRQYPVPIPACDAQFNYLWDKRSQVERELARLETARGSGQPSPAEFLAMSSVIDATRSD